MLCEKVARRNVPLPGKLLSPVNCSNFWRSENFSWKRRFVLGSHVVRRVGMPKRATSSENFSWKRRFVLG
ncbi:hypothetical protein V1477_016950 [Vespula maculifrons]|uniref:Uncharacterized protein n=1 Tax=Vespula maculifrons TaxID=7453 RepID=A0ABD2B4M0_VESMC